MSEWPRNQEFNRITISTISPESCGAEIGCFNVAPASAVWPTANTAIFVPFVVNSPIVVVKMGILNGATVSGNVDVGIYDDQQNRLISKGSTAQSGVSAVQSFDITDTSLLPGIYFMALCVDNVTATVYRSSLAITGGPAALGIYNQAVGAVTLPDPAVFAKPSGNGAIPQMFITARTVV